MGELSPVHIAIVLAIVLLVFGPKKLPEMGRSLGKGIREFKDASSGLKDEVSRGRRGRDVNPEPLADNRAAAFDHTAYAAGDQAPA